MAAAPSPIRVSRAPIPPSGQLRWPGDLDTIQNRYQASDGSSTMGRWHQDHRRRDISIASVAKTTGAEFIDERQSTLPGK
jgi:hypothetical protein